MRLLKLQLKPERYNNNKLSGRLASFDKLIDELEKKELPAGLAATINQYTEDINNYAGTEKELLKQFRTSQSKILKVVEKEQKLVPKDHYRNMWMVLGMTAFGLPIGVAFGFSLGNIGLLAIGLPFGMVIGMGLGAAMDKKAKESGKQLDVTIKY